MAINEQELNSVEHFVQNELENIIRDRCTRMGSKFNESEKEFLFGLYAGSVKDFKFLRGEKIQILGLCEVLQKIFAEKEKEEFSRHFEPPDDFTIDKGRTFYFSFGLFYGKLPSKQINKPNTDEMEAILLKKAENVFRSYDFKKCHEITKDIVKVIYEEDTIRGEIVCIFCQRTDKMHKIQYDKAGKWNFSNFKKHLAVHENKGKVRNQRSVSGNLDDLQSTHNSIEKCPKKSALHLANELNRCDELNIMEMPIVLEEFGFFYDDKTGDVPESSSIISVLFEQFENQNRQLIDSSLHSHEPKNLLEIKIDNQIMNINIAEIFKDGNCMFAAVMHQLEHFGINSVRHMKSTAELRTKVVSYITEHFDAYRHVLQLRLKCDSEKIDETGKHFLANVLSNNGSWGGSESLIAISTMFNINILVFNEGGSVSFSNGFKPEYNRCIFLAYRKNNKQSGNTHDHYDSIYKIDKQLLFKIATDLGGKMEQVNRLGHIIDI